MTKGISFKCEKCGKKLIERLPSGVWHFKFGKDPESPNEAPVDIKIFGHVKMKCIRRSCNHVNIFNHTPFTP